MNNLERIRIIIDEFVENNGDNIEKTSAELKSFLDMKLKEMGVNAKSILPMDSCFNAYNDGFKYLSDENRFADGNRCLLYDIEKKCFKLVGSKYNYSGPIYQYISDAGKRIIVGEWIDGNVHMNSDIINSDGLGEELKKVKKIPINQMAKVIIDKIYEIDEFQSISMLFNINQKSISINPSDYLRDTFKLEKAYLETLFYLSASQDYNNKKRTFEREYDVIIEKEKLTCKLSNNWKRNDFPSDEHGNYIKALVVLVNFYYSKFIKIQVINGDYYIVESTNELHIDDWLEDAFSRRYITSLLAKPFVILTGNSGTGKTRIARNFAKYMEITDEKGEKNWLIVPVGADWTDNIKVLGFNNPLADNGKGKYEKTKIFELIERANKNSNIPFFLVLDEMNLSHVERYFSDFLSHMERKDSEFELDGYEGKLSYPDNLFVVGTVNIDETTYMFSPKVLDRANVIEFKPDKGDVIKLFKEEPEKAEIEPAGYGIAIAFLKLSREIRNGKFDAFNDTAIATSDKVAEIFGELYDITKEQGFEFAFRTVKEIKQYISASYELQEDKSKFNLNQAIDEQIVQKILPKIHGNKKEIGKMLNDIEKLCDESNMTLSLNKIKQMRGKLDTVQYASFI